MRNAAEPMDLTGLWRFQPDPHEEGEKLGFHKAGVDARMWREVRVPCTFDACAPGMEAYEGTAWYVRTVAIPEAWRGGRVVLRFEGVNCHAKVWVNGAEAGEHRDPFLPFEFSIGHCVAFGEENTVAVRVDNKRLAGEVPGKERGWRTFGGILREVTLHASDLLFLEDVGISAEPEGDAGIVRLEARVRNERADACEAQLEMCILDAEGRETADVSTDAVSVPSGGDRRICAEARIDGARLWSPDDPHLYTARIRLRAAGEVVEEKRVAFGVRKIEAKDGRILLNGEPIYLTGFNRHEDSAQHGAATDLETARRDLMDMKEAGANFVRLCHYPHHPAELDLCDEIGLLAMDEIPLYWWNGNEEGEERAAAKLEAAKRQVEKMIARDKNHPSVVFWSVGNENREDLPEVAEGCRELVRLAKKLDPTRLCVHVSDKWTAHPNFEADDVVCVNGYPGFASECRGEGDLEKAAGFWREQLEKVHDKFPEKPIVVTEFGSVSFEGVLGAGYCEERHARLIEAEFGAFDAPYVAGATVWCWADHPWPATAFDFCSSLGVSPFGVVSRDRRKLAAYHATRRLFRAKQRVPEPPAPRGASDTDAGAAVTMIRHDLKNIRQVPFAEGFGIRPLRLDEIGLWTDIQRDTEEFFEVQDGLFLDQFGRDLAAVQWRSFVITNPRGAGVGVISAWYERNFKGGDSGQIHWVAVRPSYHRRGLAKAGLSYALNQMAQWHDRSHLYTQTKRLPAIRLYLEFGFVPDLDGPGAREAWLSVSEELDHPALARALGL